MSSQSKNQGEGNREAARRFNEQTEEFVHSGKGTQAIEEGTRLDEAEDEEARRMEREGLRRAREKDPQVVRNYRHGEK
jgi:hypothetical protein